MMSKTEMPMGAGTLLIGDGISMVYNIYDSDRDKFAASLEPPALSGLTEALNALAEMRADTERRLRPALDALAAMQERMRQVYDSLANPIDTSWASGLADTFTDNINRMQELMQPALDTLAELPDTLWASGLAGTLAELPNLSYLAPLPEAEDAIGRKEAVIHDMITQPAPEDIAEERSAVATGIRLTGAQATACSNADRRTARQAARRIRRRASNAATQARITICHILTAAASQNKAGSCPPPHPDIGKNTLHFFHVYGGGCMITPGTRNRITDTRRIAGIFTAVTTGYAGRRAEEGATIARILTKTVTSKGGKTLPRGHQRMQLTSMLFDGIKFMMLTTHCYQNNIPAEAAE